MIFAHITGTVSGGAGRAAWRLHEAMRSENVQSLFFSLDTWTEEDARQKKAFPLYSPLPGNLKQRMVSLWRRTLVYPSAATQQSLSAAFEAQRKNWRCETAALPFGNYNLHLLPGLAQADAIILHSVNSVVDLNRFFADFADKHIIWTLHDMNPFQGMFHYKDDEIRNAALSRELDSDVYGLKKNAYREHQGKFSVVAPSQWLADAAARSDLLGRFPAYCIPYSLNLNIYCIKDRTGIRKKLDIKPEQFVLVFISDNVNNIRKGFDLLLEALHHLSIPDMLLLAIGKKADDAADSHVRYVGRVETEAEMAEYLNAADLFVLPSREDNLPNVMLEAFACGCPVVGFTIGGVKEHVRSGLTGLLAEDISGTALASAIQQFFAEKENYSRGQIREYAVQHFNRPHQVAGYLNLIQ